MHKRILALAALGGLIALPACTSGQAAVEPQKTIANTAASELQFQVGTANLQGVAGLNTVVTFRQPNGLSALLDNTPTITLPFTNTAPPSVAANDSGTNRISGTPQTNNGQPSTDPRTFSQSVGAFAYGFLASNSTTTGANNSAFYPSTNSMPYYTAAARRAFYVGPGNPFVPNFKDGSLGTTFSGYPSGFTTFVLTPGAGTYTLAVGLPNASTPIPTFTATTTLANTTLLPNMPAPVVTSDGTGGLTVTETIPPGILETLIFIVDRNTANFYTLVMRGTGPQTATLADNLGPITGGVAGPSLNPGDLYRVFAFGFDYPAIEAVPVGANPPQAPVINNAGTPCTFSGTSSTCPGQADLTQSPPATGAE
ncbi:MAG: hypothetical protein JO036_13255 [Candidatus Eremiobacteraeota bacterium]|nr:hypothetical protein [Candidatus Eremiobacteraeota bacterium]